MRRILLAIALVIAGGGTLSPASAAPAGRELRVAVALLTERTPLSVGWLTGPSARLAIRPSLAALEAAAPQLVGKTFGVSFDCAPMADGHLSDCRPVLGIPAGVDQAAVVRAVAPMLQVDPATATMARAKRYRVTVDLAAATFPPPAVPLPPCSGAACASDPPPPPPPPPAITDPLLWLAVGRAEGCVQTAWEPMAAALSAASTALRNDAVPTDSASYRRLALAALQRRQALGACLAELKATSDAIPRSASDDPAFTTRYGSLLANYRQNDRGLIAVLGGVLDRRTGEQEEAFPF